MQIRCRFLIFIISAFLTPGCYNEVDVHAHGEDITVLYGILDPSEDTNYVKINRAFLGEEVYQIAKTRDSLEYKNIEVIIEELDEDVVLRTFPLVKTEINFKEDGIFFSPAQTVFAFAQPSPPLNYSYQYRITALIDIGFEEPKKVNATTSLINSDGITFGEHMTDRFYKVQIGETPNSRFMPRWTLTANGRIYELKMVLKYRDVMYDDTKIKRTVHMPVSFQVAHNLNGEGSMQATIFAKDFYEFIGDSIKPLTSNDGICKRVLGHSGDEHTGYDHLEFILTVGGDELNTYMESNRAPGVFQITPGYTNVENGIGLFSSRFKASVVKELSKNSYVEISTAETWGFTKALGFCDRRDCDCEE